MLKYVITFPEISLPEKGGVENATLAMKYDPISMDCTTGGFIKWYNVLMSLKEIFHSLGAVKTFSAFQLTQKNKGIIQFQITEERFFKVVNYLKESGILVKESPTGRILS